MMDDIRGSFGILLNWKVLKYLLDGLIYTIIIALLAILISILLGSVLALCRNYCNKGPSRVFKWLSVGYIELFRNTPLMLWMFFGLVFFKLPAVPDFVVNLLKPFSPSVSSVEVQNLLKMMIALTLFTSSVMAEIIRGGLNSIPRGQFEAGYSQGFGTVRTMTHIILPQAYRNIIPTMLSQAITTIKDSSYIAVAGLFLEFMARIKLTVNQANMYNGTWVSPFERGTIKITDVFVLFGFAFIVYFIINFSLSCVVRYLQNKKKTA